MRNGSGSGSGPSIDSSRSTGGSHQLLPFVSISVMIHGVSHTSALPVHFITVINNCNVDKYIYQLLNQRVDDFCLGWNTAASSASSSTIGSVNHSQNNNNNNNNNNNHSHNSIPIIPSSFAILKLVKSDISSAKYLKRIACVCDDHFRSSSVIEQMKSVYVVSSPFGLLSPQCFSNSVAKGIVSNVICDSKYKCMAFLTDARMLPGSEGGGVFYKSNSHCIGICTVPIRSKSSNIDFNLVVSLNAIHREVDDAIRLHVLQQANQKSGPELFHPIVSPSRCNASQSPFESLSPEMENAKKSIVLISIGNSWSSGIVINSRGLIMTNAHLIAPFMNTEKTALRHDVTITVQFDHDISDLNRNNQFHVASLVFINMHGPYDVALIQLNQHTRLSLRHFACIDPSRAMKQGQTVYGIGYPLYHPMTVGTAIRTSTLTRGVLSKVVRHQGTPVLLQSSALIHSGNSGGGLFGSDGSLLGLVTSNARHVTDNTSGASRLIPSLNFSLPVTRLEAVAIYAQSDYAASSLAALNQAMNVPNDEVSTVWSLKKVPPGESVNPTTPTTARTSLRKRQQQQHLQAQAPDQSSHISSKL